MKRVMSLNHIPLALRENKDNFIEYYDNEIYLKKSFQEIYFDLLRMLTLFKKRGLERGERVGIIGKNSYEYLIIDLAAVLGGYVSVAFTEKDFKNRIGSLIKDFELTLLFADEVDEKNVGMISISSINQLVQNVEEIDCGYMDIEPLNDEDAFTIIFTSGTTGSPKGIEMRVKCVEEWIENLSEKFEFYTDDKIIDFLPLSISNARLFVYGAILMQFNLTLTTSEQLLRVLAVSNPTILQGVPYLFETMFFMTQEKIKSSFLKYMMYQCFILLQRLLPQKTINKMKHKLFQNLIMIFGGKMRLIFTGSASINKDIIKFYNDIGLRIYEAYGINEVGLVSINSPDEYRIGSVGKPFQTKNIQIAPNKEILIKSDYSWGQRYINDEQGKGKHVFLRDGFIATGDMGYIDEDGFLYITGRIKEVLVLSNGDKIHPNRIEDELKGRKYIKQAVAFGDGRPFIVCVLVLSDQSASRSKIQREIDEMNKELPETLTVKDFVLIKDTFTVENGFLNSTLKVNRSAVYEAYKREIEKLYE